PLTAQSVREKFAVRAILEPAALRLAASHIDHTDIEQVRARLNAGEDLDWELLEDALMENCIARAPNAELVDLIRNNQFLLTAANRALTRLGLPQDTVALGEYRTLFDLLSRHLVDSAAEYLESHLRVMADKSLARLKIVAVISQNSAIAPYLTPK
ncbi:MAG: GntR family transcriptional regulator, partial [Alphaproteobacteria bacterium]|nr:GntR family transcriptional regulator [Alphaproteobacteria bacterium]